MPFTAWKCADCGVGGKIRHDKGATPELIGKWSSQEHAGKSPECHQRAKRDHNVLAQLTPRDRHILVTARIKRKLMADALRIQRSQERADAVVAFCQRWGVPADSLTRNERIAAYTTAGIPTRKNWLAGKVTRKGYAFT